jgi:hypothetical protein
MGFWDIFSKKEPAKTEKIDFQDLESWLKNRKQESKKQEESYIKEIQDRITQLIEELEQEIRVLEKVDISGKKAEEKIKLVVKENLQYYIYHLIKLKDKLKEISKNTESIVENINHTYADFQKKSSASFQKATFLIGQELGNVKESIGNFLRDFKVILNENQTIINNSKTFYSVEEKINKMLETKIRIQEIERAIKENKEKAVSLSKNLLEKHKEIEKIKKTEKFIAERNKKQRIEDTKKEIEYGSGNLRESIDFKVLSSFFHSIEKKMVKVKEYKDNFKQSFQRTKGEELISLLKESNLLDEEIMKKINEINKKQQEISKIVFEDTGIEKIERDIEELNSRMQSISLENTAEQKRLDKMNASLIDLIGSIKGELIKINVEVE